MPARTTRPRLRTDGPSTLVAVAFSVAQALLGVLYLAAVTAATLAGGDLALLVAIAGCPPLIAATIALTLLRRRGLTARHGVPRTAPTTGRVTDNSPPR